MMGTNNSPMVWRPSTNELALVAGNVAAGDWVQVTLSYRKTNSSPIEYTPGYFLAHVIYQPNSDDTTTHPDTATIYGGSVGLRRARYHIDTGVWFRCPFNGQLSLVSGGNSNPSTCVVDVVVRRASPPRFEGQKPPMNGDAMALMDAMADDPMAMMLMDSAMGAGPGPGNFGPIKAMSPRMWWPPVVNEPVLVPATYNFLPGNVLPVGIEFPDGAVEIEAVDSTQIPGSVIPLAIDSLGGTSPIFLASGKRQRLGPLAQGGACTDGVTATWNQYSPSGTPQSPLQSVTIWSSLGG